MKIIERLVILIIIFSVLGMIGCERKAPSILSGKNRTCPKAGACCTVQFRRDALGASANLPVPPTTDSINGAGVCVGGKFSKMNEEWVVITKDNSREIWIPRSVILLIEVGG
ncbi:MAG: hypothetical protein JW837_07400 [Sedimentisphaerales bacterium]|nr:hypothetical protein [Sedimentisphaerales bacterium]